MSTNFGAADDFYQLLLTLGEEKRKAQVWARALDRKARQAGMSLESGVHYLSSSIQYLAFVSYERRLEALRIFGPSPGVQELAAGLLARDWYDNEAVAGSAVVVAGYEEPLNCPADEWVEVLSREQARSFGLQVVPVVGLENKVPDGFLYGPKVFSDAYVVNPFAAGMNEIDEKAAEVVPQVVVGSEEDVVCKEEGKTVAGPSVTGKSEVEGFLAGADVPAIVESGLEVAHGEVGEIHVDWGFLGAVKGALLSPSSSSSASLSASFAGSDASAMESQAVHVPRISDYDAARCVGSGQTCAVCEIPAVHTGRARVKCVCGHEDSPGLVPVVSFEGLREADKSGVSGLVVWRPAWAVAVGKFDKPGAHVVAMHDCNGMSFQMYVAAAVLAVLPPGLEVEFPGGQRMFTGGSIMRLVGIDSLRFRVVSGLASGDALLFVVGSHSDKVRWMHKYGAFDTRGSGARFWTRTGANLAFLKHAGEAPSRKSAVVEGFPGVRGIAELRPGNFPCGDVKELDGASVFEVVTEGRVEPEWIGSAVYVERGSVVVSTGGLQPVVFRLSGKQTLGWFSSFRFGVEKTQEAVVKLVQAEDEYELDDGGPSDDEGFLSEF